MLKKFFSIFILLSFVSNIVTLNALAYNTQPNATNNPIEKLPEAMSLLMEDLEGMEKWSPDFGFLKNNIEEYQILVEKYLNEFNSFEVAPGCLPLYSLSFLNIFILTPSVGVFAVDSFYSPQRNLYCNSAYIVGMFVPLTWGLINWIDYRICAEENSDSPDQKTIALLQQDKGFLWLSSLAFSSATIALWALCRL